MKMILSIMALLMSTAAVSEPRVDHLSLDIKRMPYQRDYFFPGRTEWGHELRLNWDVSWGRFFWQNEIPARTYDSRFRYVGWKYDAGINILPGLDAVWSHFSQHALDEYRQEFPILDAYGVRVTWFDRKRK